MEQILRINQLKFAWTPNEPALLDIPSLKVDVGEKLFLHGPSGSGKSTLLNLIAGVLSPQAGEVEVAGISLAQLSVAQRDRLRGDHMGFIFQMFNLLPYLSAVENVCLPCQFSQSKSKKVQNHGVRAEAMRLLDELGLKDQIHRPVTQMSVGQQQRVATARALMGSPELVIADEPTSALDADVRDRFLQLLFAECDRTQASLVFVSHDHSLSPSFDRVVPLNEINKTRGLG